MTKTAAEIRRDLKERNKKHKKNFWFTLKDGKTKYLFVGKPWKKGGEFWRDVLTHGYFKDKVYCRRNETDPKTGKKKKCPVCIRLRELASDRSTLAKKLWGLIKQGQEGLWNVLVAKKFIRKNNGKIIVKRYEDNTFKVFRLSPKWQNLMMDIFGDEDFRSKSILGITHPKFGRLVKATRRGSGREDTAYLFRVIDKEVPISKSKERRLKLLKTLVNLDEVVKISSKEECEAFLERMEKKARRLAAQDKERESDDEDDFDDADEDEEETDDDGEDSDEEDDMESRYERMKKKAKKKKHHDDE